MKAKDIALLCTAAAGAGAAASAAVLGKNKAARKESKAAPKTAKAPVREKNISYTISQLDIDKLTHPSYIGADNDCGIVTAVFGSGKDCRAFVIKDAAPSEIRCPAGITGAESINGCTFFITVKGGVFVYEDADKEPEFCGLTAPEYICAFGGKFYIFSDSLLYICTPDIGIEKTVSLGALIDISISDICDAESSDGNFSAAAVHVKKAAPLGKTGFAAVITDEGKSYLMHSDSEGFCSFEKTYENVKDVCTYDRFAYYLYDQNGDYGIIKTKLMGDKCETMAKYSLGKEEKIPVKLHSGKSGLGVLYNDGSIRFLLPEIRSEAAKKKCRAELNGMNNAFSQLKADDIFTLDSQTAALCDGSICIACPDNND